MHRDVPRAAKSAGTGTCDGESRGRGSPEPDGLYQAHDLSIQGGKK